MSFSTAVVNASINSESCVEAFFLRIFIAEKQIIALKEDSKYEAPRF